MLCWKKTASKAKEETGYTGSWHPLTLAQNPPIPHPPHLKPPQMGFWQQVVPKKTTKNAKKHLKLKKKLFVDQPVNLSAALVTGV